MSSLHKEYRLNRTQFTLPELWGNISFEPPNPTTLLKLIHVLAQSVLQTMPLNPRRSWLDTTRFRHRISHCTQTLFEIDGCGLRNYKQSSKIVGDEFRKFIIIFATIVSVSITLCLFVRELTVAHIPSHFVLCDHHIFGNGGFLVRTLASLRHVRQLLRALITAKWIDSFMCSWSCFTGYYFKASVVSPLQLKVGQYTRLAHPHVLLRVFHCACA